MSVALNDVLAQISYSDTHNRSWQQNGALKYVSQFSKYWDSKNDQFKTTCEIGPLGFLLERIEREDYFKSYITQKYPKADIQRLKKLGTDLKRIAPRRNDAAHGGNYLTYTDVCTDKNYVYNSVATFKGLILDFLDIIL